MNAELKIAAVLEDSGEINRVTFQAHELSTA